MRWGVRKEYESVGRNKSFKRSKTTNSTRSASEGDLVDLNDPSTWKPNPGDPNNKDSDFITATKIYSEFSSKIYNSENFVKYLVNKKTYDGAIKLIEDYEKAMENFLDRNKSSDERKAYRDEAVKCAQEMEALITEFGQTSMNEMTEEEIAVEETWAKMADLIASGEFSEVLANGSSITMGRYWDGVKYVPKYYFKGRNGMVKSFKFGEEEALKEYASNEKKENVDFRKSTLSKSREKNTDPASKPVSLKKHDKIEVSKEERRQKQQNSRNFYEKTRSDIKDLTQLNKLNKYGMDSFRRDNIINKREYSNVVSSGKKTVNSAINKLSATSVTSSNAYKEKSVAKTKSIIEKIGSTIVDTAKNLGANVSTMISKSFKKK